MPIESRQKADDEKPEYRFYRCAGKPSAAAGGGSRHYFHPDSFMGYICPACGANVEVVYSSVQPAMMKRIAYEKCNECPQSVHKGLGAAGCVGNTHNNSGCVTCICKECCAMMRRLAAKIQSGEKTLLEIIREQTAGKKPGPLAAVYNDVVPF